jgi:hypothetical protein
VLRRQPLYSDPNKCSPHTTNLFCQIQFKIICIYALHAAPNTLILLGLRRTNYETNRHFLHSCYYLPLRSKHFPQQSDLTHPQPVRCVLSGQSRHAIEGRNPVWIKNRWLWTKTNCKGDKHLLTGATNIYIITVVTALYIYIYIYIHTHTYIYTYIYTYIWF